MVRSRVHLIALVVGALLVAACQSTGPGYDRPARIVTPDADSRTALQNAVSSAVGVEVTLADDALTESSLLILERAPRPSLQNAPVTGRNMDAPIQFRLVVNRSDCVLIDQRSRSRYPLAHTRCEPE